ncbi:MAG: non-ribosomal peptide synthetase [Pseudonocardiaceae bacterium]
MEGPYGLGTIIDLFAKTAAKHPDRPAASDGHRRLSYMELDTKARALADELRTRGIGREDHVALHLVRGVQVFVALLGVLKAGAAYVPVDTRYPDTRRDLMMRDSRAKLVITEPDRVELLAGLGVEVYGLDLEELTSASPEQTYQVDERDAAAVLFTSGSSGQPKAVVLEHRNIVHFARNISLPALMPDDRVGHISSLSFDAFHFETWCAFAAGAEIVVLPTMPDLINSDIQRELRRRRITAMLVPTMAVNHVMREDRHAFSPLRILHTGGDVISPTACRELLNGSFSGIFSNLYGPTEATTACTVHQINEVAADADTVPIGTPLAGSSVYLLDDWLDEVAEGVVGQLHIGGSGVARGYLAQGSLTAEKFLPDPFAAEGRRMYATGDRAVRCSSGVLEYVGRTDDQVKIRGHRVEPREVERTLSQHKEVREAAVLVAGGTIATHLVALVVSDEQISPKQLRKYAVSVMPDFMVPGSFVLVPEIPANDHGKRDLDQLRQLADEHVRRGENRVAPRDQVERHLAAIWEDLLAVEQIGATDDFFALGGNSLLAFRVQRRISRELGVALEPRDVLTNSELGGLATLIRERKETVTS